MTATIAPRPRRRRHAQPERKPQPGIGPGRGLGVMVLLLFASLFPFFWMLRTALSSNNALYAGSQSSCPCNPRCCVAPGVRARLDEALDRGRRATSPTSTSAACSTP